MADLRERFAVLFACRCDPAWTDRRLHAPDCVQELGEDTLDAVAEWLRERADAAKAEAAGRGVCRCGRRTVVSERAGRIAALGALADEIAPKAQPACTERWGDEVGCNDGTNEHRCIVTEPSHRWHHCPCGAAMREDTA